MLPAGLPVLPDVGVAAEYRPANSAGRAGGDWFDVVVMPDNTLGLVVGDVVGHGATASAVMGQLRAIASERLSRGSDLGEVIRALDAFAGRSPGARGGTVCVAVVDRAGGSVEYAVRGHPPPLVVGASCSTRYLPATGSPLALPGQGFRLARDTLRAGDTIVLYSNGAITRAGRTLAVGMSELARCAAEVVGRHAGGERWLSEQICQAVAGSLDDGTRNDDVGVLAATLLSVPPIRLVMSVPATADQLGLVRRRFADWLSDLRVREDDLVALELGLVEAATNSIEHAYPDRPGVVRIDAQLERDGHVCVVVADNGRWKVPRANPGFRGRGLVMMREFSDTLRVQPSPRGTTVTFVRVLQRPVAPEIETVSQARRPDRTEFEIDLRVDPGEVVMSVAGAVDSSSLDRLHACLLDVGRTGSLPLTIVLDEVTLLTSAGLRMLYEHAGNLLAAQRRLRMVVAPASPARDALAISGLDGLIEVVSTARPFVPDGRRR
jgi:anti-sigma regulatory factor (Ser/Thr protein kinase)